VRESSVWRATACGRATATHDTACQSEHHGMMSAIQKHRREERSGRTTMNPKDEDFICFYRDAVIAGHDDPAAETMRRFNLS